MDGGKEDADVFERVCAWCGEHLGGTVGAEMVTHGICERCAVREVETFQGVPYEERKLDAWVDLGGEG